MLVKLFAIYDGKGEFYTPPLAFKTTGEAIRAFSDTVNERGHQMNRHPEDYTLFQIGTYDDAKGFLIADDANTALGLGLEYAMTPQLHEVS